MKEDGMYWGAKELNDSGEDEYKEEPSYLEIVDNHIYFYSEVKKSKILKLIQNIQKLNNRLLVRERSFKVQGYKIYLHINSFGGDVFSGLAAMDSILQSEIPVVTIVDGACASAASFLSIVGKERYINPHSYMMIHQISSAMWGKYEEFKDEMKNLESLMTLIKRIYKKYTKIPKEKLNLNELLKHDIWLNAEECLEYGLVDDIVK